MKTMIAILTTTMMTGCGSAIRDSASEIADPTERGLMYLATAIVLAAIIGAFFRH